ncbi:MAG: hypothetical protein HYX24_06265 [Candidatus Aenigmarchaeota archaeon]|nr:hypothetical protein [Candidatus Aenigmarchaeota archaeon]
MKITDLKPGMNRVNLEAKIDQLDETQEVMTKFGIVAKLTNIMISDDSGKIKLVIWGDTPVGIKKGSKLDIKNAFVKAFRGEKQIGVARSGKIEVVK